MAVLCFASYIYAAAAAWYTHYGPKYLKVNETHWEWHEAQWTPLSCASLMVPVVELVFIITFSCDTLAYYWGEWVTAYVALLAPLLYVYTLSHRAWWRWEHDKTLYEQDNAQANTSMMQAVALRL